MARRTARPAAPQQYRLEPYQRRCPGCAGPARVAYHDRRTVATLDGLYDLVLVVRLCRDPACPLYRKPYRPEEEGGWALPHGEFGLDVIALVGALRYGEHRSVPEIHQLCWPFSPSVLRSWHSSNQTARKSGRME